MELPKFNKSQEIGERGVTIVKRIIENDLGWVFRKNHQEYDFGIDAYIDIITEFGHLTGKSIALQIKTGKSYFEETTELGWVYRGQASHLNYYLNHQLPVLIFIVDIITEEIYWCFCDANKTDKAGENWKITIPKSQRVNKNSKNDFLKYISPTIDYVSQLEGFWQTNRMLKEHQRIILIVAKEEILEFDFENLLMAFQRFEASEDLIINLRGKVDVFIYGYDDDPRELYDIPEVMEWAREIFKWIDSWIYFLSLDNAAQFIKVLFIAHVIFNRISPTQIEYETQYSANFFESVFEKLNRFCDEFSISDEVNIEICSSLMNQLTSGEFQKHMNSGAE